MSHFVNGIDLVPKASERKSLVLATESSLNNVISNTDPAALDSLTEIVTAFQANDGQLTNAINALGTSSSSNFAAVNARVDAEIADRQAAVTAVEDALSDEVTRATGAEATLTTSVNGINETLEALLV